MNQLLKPHLITFLLSLFLYSISSAQFTKDSTHSISITPQLPVPFGTIVSVTAVIVDGDSLMRKEFQGEFLLKISQVDSMRLSTPLIIRFNDETGNWPNGHFALYKFLYKKNANTITNQELTAMKSQYVGKTANLLIYEAGMFTGIPNNYHKYAEIRAGVGFQFQQHVVVIK